MARSGAQMSLRLHLFGPPKIRWDGAWSALPFERRHQLLVLLAFRRTWVARAELAALLWPEQPDKLAYTNLRKTLFRLQSLPWAGCIEMQGTAMRLDAPTDVVDFESALREQRSADALPLYGGELLAGYEAGDSEAWASWLNFERDRLRVAWRSAALEHLLDDIDAGEAIALSARLLEADPLDEAALRAHMRWLAQGGQAAAARRAYREFVDRLTKDLGIAPSAELALLHETLGTPAGSAPLAATVPKPAPDDGFVGRSVELRKIAELLAQHECRMLCLIGPGGIGKTRLARRAIGELAPAYRDGTVFVPLDDIHSAAEIGGRLAREIGITLAGSREPLEQVIEFLRTRQMLLVLDNFEQLVADAAVLEPLLQACAGLKLIVTTRVRLALAAQWSLPIEGLPCPEPEDQDRIEAFDAARLFVKAAQRVEPALIPEVEAAAIVDICRQVEGLPLALELAAAWTRVLSCAAIAAELRVGSELLRAVDAAHPARHASIEVVFQQSWQQLGAAERDALARLSVFRGGFSAESARAVAATALPVLGALADKSLLRKDGPRLALHPLVQQLAALRLDDVARAATQAAHAAYFHRLLGQLAPAADAGDRAALRAIDAEFENCRLAWQHAIDLGPVEALRRSAFALLDYCDHRGRFEDGLALLRQAIVSPRVDAAAQAQLLSQAAHLEYRLNRYRDAGETAGRALAAARSSRERETRLQALKVLGSCALRQGRLDEARRHFEQARLLAPRSIDPHNAAALLDNLALVEKATGRYDEALRHSRESLVEHRRLDNPAGAALCLNNIASLHMARQEYDAAGAHMHEALAICERDGFVSTRSFILTNLAALAMMSGDRAAAETWVSRALEAAEATGNRALASAMQLQGARLAVQRGDAAAARAAMAAGLSAAIELGTASLRTGAVVCFAELLEIEGEASLARRLLAYAAEHPTTSAPDRDEIRAQLLQWGGLPGGETAWSGLDLDDLLHRIVAEAGIDHAPLIALLRETR